MQDVSGQTDAELCDWVAAGDSQARSALEVLMSRYGRRLEAFVVNRGCSRDSASDVCQEVWMRVWRKPPAITGAPFSAWLFEVCRRVLVDFVRTRIRRREVQADDIDVADSDPTPELIDESRKNAVEECQKGLTKREKGVFTMRMQGIEYSEICAEFGVDANAAYKATNSAISKLSECVKRKLA